MKGLGGFTAEREEKRNRTNSKIKNRALKLLKSFVLLRTAQIKPLAVVYYCCFPVQPSPSSNVLLSG